MGVNRIKLVPGDELNILLKRPNELALVVEIASNYNSGVDVGDVQKMKTYHRIGFDNLRMCGVLTVREERVYFCNKKVIDVTLKKKPQKSKLENMLLKDICNSDLDNTELVYFEIAKIFQSMFISSLTILGLRVEEVKKAKYNWISAARLMLTDDKITKEQLRKVYDYLNINKETVSSVSKIDEGRVFWVKNCRSLLTLRKKFENIHIKTVNHARQIGQREKSSTCSDAISSLFNKE